MAVIREGNQSVLLVVDVQVGVLRNGWDAARIIQNIGFVIDKARLQNIPIIWVQHSDEELIHGSPDWQIVPELRPAKGEEVIFKHFNSSFEETALEKALSDIGATRIVIAGAATNWCIRATTYGALERGYDLTLLSDAHTTESIELENGVIIEAEKIVSELNLVMNWLSYPDRKNNTSSVQTVEFVTPSDMK